MFSLECWSQSKKNILGVYSDTCLRSQATDAEKSTDPAVPKAAYTMMHVFHLVNGFIRTILCLIYRFLFFGENNTLPLFRAGNILVGNYLPNFFVLNGKTWFHTHFMPDEVCFVLKMIMQSSYSSKTFF